MIFRPIPQAANREEDSMLTHSFQLDDIRLAATEIFSKIEILSKIKYPISAFHNFSLNPACLQPSNFWCNSSCISAKPLGLLCSPGSSLHEFTELWYSLHCSIEHWPAIVSLSQNPYILSSTLGNFHCTLWCLSGDDTQGMTASHRDPAHCRRGEFWE